MVKLLTIIVTYNAKPWLDRCLCSVFNSTVKSDVYVVDNGSNDGTQALIKSKYEQCIFIQSDFNLGFGRANNQGLQYALNNKYDYVYLLNQDAWVYEDTFEILLKAYEKNSDYGIISPLQLKSSLEGFDDSFYSLCMSNLMVFQNIVGGKKELSCIQKRDVFETDFAMAAHWMIPRKCLLTVGGFSPSFPHYGEDNNFIDRCRYHGYKVGISFDAMAIHDRENRPLALKKVMYLEYIHEINYLSDPCEDSPKIWKVMFLLLKSSLKHISVAPIHYMCKILWERKKLINNRDLSKADGPSFLDMQNDLIM